MMKWKRKVVIVGLVGVSVGCAPSGTPEETAPARAEVVAPLPGTNYTVFYMRDSVVWKRDTRVGTDSAIDGGGSNQPFAPTAMGRTFAAVRATGGSDGLFLVGDAERLIGAVHGGGEGAYTFAWSADGSRLAFGYRPSQSSDGSRGVWIVGPDGESRSVGCRAADRVHAWKGDRNLLVGDASNVYTVNAQNCATLATLPRRGKRDFSFAADGSRLSFLRNTPQGAALYVANNDGSGAQRIADPQVRPRNVEWAPDGSKVAFEIDSPRFANRTHVAVHDMASGSVSYNDRETQLGVPNEGLPCWSPDSRRVLFDRIFDRSDGVQSYQTRQKIVKSGAVETLVFEELRREGAGVNDNPCRWLDDQNILITSNDGYRVINVDSRDDFMIGPVEAVLVVRIHE